MNKKQYLIFCIVPILFSYSCRNDISYDLPGIEEKIVVDGWIEQNKYPVIILTKNAPYFSTVDSASLRDLILPYAKVTVSDGENSEALSVKSNDDYFPPLYYGGSQIKGVVGKTYYMTVEFEGKKITAYTTIPRPVFFDSIGFYHDSDSSGYVYGRFTDNADEHNFYRTFTKVLGKDKNYIPTMVSNYNDKYFNGQSFTFELKRGQETYLNPDVNIHFSLGDTIMVRLCTVDKRSFDFWTGYQNEVLSAGNPFASTYSKIESNIEGGLGIWCGYGATYYRVVAK